LYSKLFACILDSSVWLEPHPTRLVWITLLAAKDETGFARFAAHENLARRANVTMEEVETAIAVLEAPDPNSSNKDREGRRIERVPGGWMVVSAGLYDGIVRREDQRRQTRERVRKFRERQAGHPGDDDGAEGSDEGESAPESTSVNDKSIDIPSPPPGTTDILSLIPEIYRSEVEGEIRAHRTPIALLAEFRALNQGMHHPPQSWETIGRAVHEMRVAGVAMTARALWKFCEGTVPLAKGNGAKLGKIEQGRANLAEWAARERAKEAAEAESVPFEVVPADDGPAAFPGGF